MIVYRLQLGFPQLPKEEVGTNWYHIICRSSRYADPLKAWTRTKLFVYIRYVCAYLALPDYYFLTLLRHLRFNPASISSRRPSAVVARYSNVEPNTNFKPWPSRSIYHLLSMTWVTQHQYRCHGIPQYTASSLLSVQCRCGWASTWPFRFSQHLGDILGYTFIR